MAAMNCNDFKDELLLYFGSNDLPEDLSLHIKECDQCREYYEEHRNLSKNIGTDRDFYPDDFETEILLKQVEDKIDTSSSAPARISSWYGVVGLAASIFLVIGISIFGNFFKSLPVYDDNSQSSRLDLESITYATVDESYYEMSDDEIQILVIDYMAGRTYEAAGQLLDDLSEEELRYLEENFDVGDLF